MLVREEKERGGQASGGYHGVDLGGVGRMLKRFGIYNNHNTRKHSEWNYQVDNWAELEDAPFARIGKKQSPVHIRTKDCVDFSHFHPLKLYREETTPKIAKCAIKNTGHCAQVDWKDVQKATIRLSNHKYELLQFHMHCPAEHKVDDEPFHKAELHLVHRNVDPEYPHDIVVIAVFFDIGDESAFFKSYFHKIPEGDKADTEEEVFIQLGLLPLEPYFWRYYGSLTTPPCSEDVKWIVMHDAQTMSQDQLNHYTKMFGNNKHRTIQPLNDRVITTYKRPAEV